jgi:hypothetical protein
MKHPGRVVFSSYDKGSLFFTFEGSAFKVEIIFCLLDVRVFEDQVGGVIGANRESD